jgi:hypothetical protein
MTRFPPVELDGHEVADSCRTAAQKLRFRPGAEAHAERMRMNAAVGNLLDAVARALRLNRSAIPEDVQRAALRVAQHVHMSRQPGTDGYHRRDGGPDTRREVVRGEAVPFEASIRLGRMG